MKFRAGMVAGLIAAVLLPLLAAAQTQEYKDPSGKFSIELAGDWRAISYNDAVGRAKVEFVYRDRSEGLLKIRRESLGGRPVTGVVQEEEENSRMYRSGFELPAKEPFAAGPLRGMRLSFFYVSGGRRMAATFYYLQQGDAVWVLEFTGRRGSLDTIRNLTDQMARSFRASV